MLRAKKQTQSEHSRNISGPQSSHSLVFMALTWQGAHPYALTSLFLRARLFLQAWQFVCGTELLRSTRLRATSWVGRNVLLRELIRGLRVVFNSQLQRSSCILDHIVYLEGITQSPV